MAELSESKIIGACAKELRILLPEFEIIRHEDRITSGIPDISATGLGYTTWIEGKFANPNFQSKGIQELTMLRLAKRGRAIYVVWELDEKDKFTYIVHPRDIGKDRSEWTDIVAGFNHTWLAGFIRENHSSPINQRELPLS